MENGDNFFDKFRYLPTSVKAYLAIASLLCIGITFSIINNDFNIHMDYWSLFILGVLAIILGFKPLSDGRSGEFHLLSLIWFTSILLFEPGVVFLFVAVTSFVPDLLRKARKTAILINIIESALGHYFAAVVFHLLKSDIPIHQDLVPNIIALVASVFVIQMLFIISHGFMYSKVYKKPLADALKEVARIMPLIEIGQYSTAILLGIIINVQKAAVVLFILPIALFYITSNYQIKLKKKEKEAILDQLSGLYNRRHFDDVLNKYISEKNKRKFAILLIDADNFKNTNDQLGHVEGDRTIKKISIIIKNVLRDEDTAFRYGGEEFSVVLPSLSKEEANVIAERIRKKTASTFKHDQVKTTLSIGISEFPSDAKDVESLLIKADEALYRAKSNGKNCVISA